MNLTADTNILVRLLVEDDPQQAAQARKALSRATELVVPLAVLCELCWVLRAGYGRSKAEIAAAIDALLATESLVTDMAAAEVGLALLRGGGDFADGIIAHRGVALGASALLTFDREAVAGLHAIGYATMHPEDLAEAPP